MAEHTKGPWKVGKTFIVDADGKNVAIATDGHDEFYDQMVANAAHIVKCVNAFEPGGLVSELVEALKDMLEDYEMSGATDGSDDDPKAAKCARSALSRAREAGYA